jgi:hypothetical protein
MRVLFWTLPWQVPPPAERAARRPAPAAEPVPVASREDPDRVARTLQQPELPWCFDAQLW